MQIPSAYVNWLHGVHCEIFTGIRLFLAVNGRILRWKKWKINLWTNKSKGFLSLEKVGWKIILRTSVAPTVRLGLPSKVSCNKNLVDFSYKCSCFRYFDELHNLCLLTLDLPQSSNLANRNANVVEPSSSSSYPFLLRDFYAQLCLQTWINQSRAWWAPERFFTYHLHTPFKVAVPVEWVSQKHTFISLLGTPFQPNQLTLEERSGQRGIKERWYEKTARAHFTTKTLNNVSFNFNDFHIRASILDLYPKITHSEGNNRWIHSLWTEINISFNFFKYFFKTRRRNLYGLGKQIHIRREVKGDAANSCITTILYHSVSSATSVE